MYLSKGYFITWYGNYQNNKQKNMTKYQNHDNIITSKLYKHIVHQRGCVTIKTSIITFCHLKIHHDARSMKTVASKKE